MFLLSSNITIVIPRRGINDEGKGKKHALYRLISEAQTEYVWMQDDDVIIKNDELRMMNLSFESLQDKKDNMDVDHSKFKIQNLISSSSHSAWSQKTSIHPY